MPIVSKKSCNSCGKSYHKLADYKKDTTGWRLCMEGHLWFNCPCQSTLVLRSGSFDWYRPHEFLDKDLTNVFHKVGERGDIFYISDDYQDLRTELNQPDVSLERVAERLIEAPLLAARILEEATQIRKFRDAIDQEFSSLAQACAYLGLNRVSSIILFHSLQQMPNISDSFDLNSFWERSLLTGRIAEKILKLRPGNSADLVYLCGALANIGILIEAVYFPEEYEQMRANVDKGYHPNWSLSETYLCPVNHMELGELFAKLWQLPHCVSEVTRYHHDLEKVQERQYRILTIAALAVQVAHIVNQENEKVDQKIYQTAAETLMLSPKNIKDIVIQFKAAV